MIDAQLGDDAAVGDGDSAQRLHQRLFDVELAVTNVARFAQAISRMTLPPDQRALVRLALQAVVDRDPVAAQTHAASLMDLLRTDPGAGARRPYRRGGDPPLRRLRALSWPRRCSAGPRGDAAVEEDAATFTPSVLLFGGWLPGSAGVSAVASQEPGASRWDRIAVQPYVRAAVQVSVAVAGGHRPRSTCGPTPASSTPRTRPWWRRSLHCVARSTASWTNRSARQCG